VERAQAKPSFKERLHSQSSPPMLLPSWLREAPRSGPSDRAGIKAGRTITARFVHVNRKMGI
jgi:hypothetical protein